MVNLCTDSLRHHFISRLDTVLKIISIISIPEAFIQKGVRELSWQKGFVHSDMLKGLEIRSNSNISSSWVKVLIYRKYFKNRSFEEILYGSGFSFLEALELTLPGKSLQIQSQWFVCPHSHFARDNNFLRKERVKHSSPGSSFLFHSTSLCGGSLLCSLEEPCCPGAAPSAVSAGAEGLLLPSSIWPGSWISALCLGCFSTFQYIFTINLQGAVSSALLTFIFITWAAACLRCRSSSEEQDVCLARLVLYAPCCLLLAQLSPSGDAECCFQGWRRRCDVILLLPFVNRQHRGAMKAAVCL